MKASTFFTAFALTATLAAFVPAANANDATPWFQQQQTVLQFNQDV